MGNPKQTNKETAHCCKKAETVFSHALATLYLSVRWSVGSTSLVLPLLICSSGLKYNPSPHVYKCGSRVSGLVLSLLSRWEEELVQS